MTRQRVKATKTRRAKPAPEVQFTPPEVKRGPYKLIKAKTENQRAYIRAMVENDVTICSGPSGCVDEETEFLSQDGWKKISDYNHNDLVMQYNPITRTGELVKPIRFIKSKSDGFYYIRGKYGLNQMLSKEHNILYETSKGNIGFKTCATFIEMHNTCKLGFSGKILTTYDYNGRSLNLTEEEIRLQVAIKADGSILPIKKSQKYVINVKKQRKKDRIQKLLNDAKIKYAVCNKKNGFTAFTFYHNCSKFLSDWMFCSKRDAEIICDELKYWDGRFEPSGNRMSDFSTSIKKEADTVQYFYNICGYRTNIRIDDRVGKIIKEKYIRKTIQYTVCPTTSNRLGFSSSDGKKIDIKFIEPEENEYKYCFEVPCGALVLRRGNQVFITGNSGKSLVALSTAIEHVMRDDKPQSKIYITRPMIATSNRDFPYIKGTLIEKLQPYFSPILSNLQDLLNSKLELERLLANETIVMQAIELMRGFTYKNCFVLITESQNMTVAQSVMAITRLGENCKMIFEGDTDQKDLFEYDGLSYLKDKLKNSPDLCGMVSMGKQDILRHPLIGRILDQLDYKGKAGI